MSKEKILKELSELRKKHNNRTIAVKPTDSVSSVLQQSSGIVCYDFATLYPRIQRFDVGKNFLRKIKIKKILQTI